MKKKFIKSSKKIFSLVLIFTLAIVLSTSQLSTALADEQSPNTTTLTQEDVNVPSEGNTGDKASDPKTEVPAESEAKADEAKTETNTPAESEVKPDEAKEDTNTPAESEVKDDNANIQDTQENGAITENNEGLSIINQFAEVRTLAATPVIDVPLRSSNVVLINEATGVQTAHATIGAAQIEIGTQSGDFTIVIMKDYYTTSTDATTQLLASGNGNNANVTITGLYNNGTADVRKAYITGTTTANPSFYASGKTTFKSINLDPNAMFYGNGKELTIGDDVITSGTNNTIYAGQGAAVTGNASLTIKSGSWGKVSQQKTGTLTGDVNITIGGTAKVTQIVGEGSVVGNININVDGSLGATLGNINSAVGKDYNLTFTSVTIPTLTQYKSSGNSTYVTVNGAVTLPSITVNDCTLNEGSTLTVNQKIDITNNLNLNTNSKLVAKGSAISAANTKTNNVNILGSGSEIDIAKGTANYNADSYFSITGTVTGTDKIKLDYFNGANPITGHQFVKFPNATLATANGDKFVYARTNGNSGFISQGTNIIYDSLIIPGYSIGGMSTSPTTISNVKVGVLGSAPSIDQNVILGQNWAFKFGQLSAKVPGFFSEVAFGNIYQFTVAPNGEVANAELSVKVGGTPYTLTRNNSSATDPGYYRGYKLSADNKSISFVFDLGENVGVFYYDMTAKGTDLNESWRFENKTGAAQDILVTHGTDITYAGGDYSYSIFLPGKNTAALFQDFKSPGFFAVNDTPGSTPFPAVAGRPGTFDDKIILNSKDGIEFTSSNGRTVTSGAKIDTGVGLQWKVDGVPAGGTQTGAGHYTISKTGAFQFTAGNVKLRNPDAEEGTKIVAHSVLNLSGGNATLATTPDKWEITAPSGITVTPPPSITSNRFDVALFNYSVKVDLSVPAGIHEIVTKVTVPGEASPFYFSTFVEVIRDQYDVTTVVKDTLSNLPIDGIITGINTEKRNPIAATNDPYLPALDNKVDKFYNGRINWTLSNTNYSIESITVNGVSVSPADLAAANLNNTLAFTGVKENRDIVITVKERDPNLIISKVVEGIGSSPNDTFDFSLRIVDKNGLPLPNGTILTYTGSALVVNDPITKLDGNIIIGADGVGTFTLKHGEVITINELPRNSKVVVQEILPSPTSYISSYSVNAATFVAGAVTGELVMNANTNVAFRNNDPIAKIKNLTVSNAVSGTYGNKSEQFTFTLTVVDKNGAPYTGVTTLNYTGDIITGSGVIKPSDGTLTLDAEGKATFTLKHGQKIVIAGVKSDSQVQVVKTAGDGYTDTFKDSFDSSTTKTGVDTGLSSMNLMDRTFDFMGHKELVETGITNNNIGVVTVIVVATVALAFMLVASRRRRRG